MLFIVGPHSAGKTTIAKSLEAGGFLHVETGDIVRRKHKEVAPEYEFHEWVSVEKHNFDHFIAEEVISARTQIEQSGGKLQDVLITGNRQVGGIDYLIKNIPSFDGRPNLIIYVEANEQVLFSRYVERDGSFIDGMTFEKFKGEILDFDIKMGLEKIRDRANLVICNEGEINCCVNYVTRFLESNGYRFNGRAIEGNSKSLEIR